MSAIQKTQKDEALEALIVGGDLSRLNAAQRVDYYRAFCEHLDLNPVTRPFDYLSLGGKIVLYANKGCTEQLRTKRGISCRATKRETVGDVYFVEVEATLGSRVDFATGAVSIAGLKGEAHANAVMKAETKAKRRATLSICGLGMMDESEVDSVPGSRRVAHVELETAEHPKLAAAPSAPAPPAAANEVPNADHDPNDDTFDGFMADTRPAPAPAAPLPITNNQLFLSKMKEECSRVGLPAYMTVLGRHGFESAINIVERVAQMSIYNALVDLPDEVPGAQPKAARLAEKLGGRK